MTLVTAMPTGSSILSGWAYKLTVGRTIFELWLSLSG